MIGKELFLQNFGRDNEQKRIDWISSILSEIPAGMRLIDVGAGELRYKKYCNHLEYVSQDFCQYDGVGDTKGFQSDTWDTSKIDIVSDITKIPVSDSSFDVVLCAEVFEHIPDPLRAFSEMDRILRPGGYIILTAPFCSFTHFAPFHYMTGFSKYFYLNLFKEKYIIEKIDANGNAFEYYAQEMRYFPRIISQYCSCSINLVDKFLLAILILRLKHYMKNSNASEELLCTGYMCLAKKQ